MSNCRVEIETQAHYRDLDRGFLAQEQFEKDEEESKNIYKKKYCSGDKSGKAFCDKCAHCRNIEEFESEDIDTAIACAEEEILEGQDEN
jgi:hypothetical protein